MAEKKQDQEGERPQGESKTQTIEVRATPNTNNLANNVIQITAQQQGGVPTLPNIQRASRRFRVRRARERSYQHKLDKRAGG